LVITLVTLATATIYGLVTYLHYCDDTKNCKFSHRSDDDDTYEYNYADYYDFRDRIIDESVDFVVIIVASALCTVWWVSDWIELCDISYMC